MAPVPRRPEVLKLLRRLGVGQRSLAVTSLGAVDVATGTALLWPTAITLPEGYLEANGQNVGRLDYPELFTIYGITFGAGDGSTTFKLPTLTNFAPTNFRYVIRA
jgi:hypothetical protein